MNNRVLPTNKCQIYKIYHIRSTVVGCIHKTAIHLRLNLLLLLVDQTCLVNPRTTSAIGRRMIRRSPRISFWRIQRPMNNSTEKCPCFCTEVYPFGLQGCTSSDCSRKSNAMWWGTAPEVWGWHPKQSTEADQSDDALVDCCSSNRYGSMHGVRFDRLHLWFHKSGYSWHGNKKGGLIYCHWIFGWFTGCMQQKCARSAARVSGRSHSTTCLDPEINCYSIHSIVKLNVTVCILCITWARKLRMALHLGHPFLCIQVILLYRCRWMMKAFQSRCLDAIPIITSAIAGGIRGIALQFVICCSPSLLSFLDHSSTQHRHG